MSGKSYHLDTLSTDTRRAAFRILKGVSVPTNYKTSCVNEIKNLLNKCDATKGRANKALMAIKILEYVIKQITFMAAHERFCIAVVSKAKEFQQEPPIDDVYIEKKFREVIQTVLAIYDQ